MAAPLSPRRQRRFDKRRNEILEEALALIVREGIQGFTLTKLAAALDCAIGGLYRYFPSRDVLLATVVLEVVSKVGEHLVAVDDEVVPAAPRPLGLARAVAMIHAYRTFSEVSSNEFGLLAQLLGDPRPLVTDQEAARVIDVTLPVLQHVAKVLDAAAREGSIQSGTTPRRALVLWAGLHGTLQLKKLGRFGNQALVSAGIANDLGDDLLVAWGSSREALAGAKAELKRLVPHLAPPEVDPG